jgi:hypothetical protein
MVEFAARVDGAAVSVRVPEAMVTGVVCVMVPQLAVIVAVPICAPGVRMTVAYPWVLVKAVVGLTAPRVVVNVTVSPGSGFPLSVTRAVTVEVMVELAASVVGFAESDRVPGAIVTDVDLDTLPQAAVTVAVPVVDPGVR